MSNPINGCEDDSYFEKDVESEWKTCISMLEWLYGQEWWVKEKRRKFTRLKIMQKYWEDRLKLVQSIILNEREEWLGTLQAKYCSGFIGEFKRYIDEVSNINPISTSINWKTPVGDNLSELF